MQLLWVLRSLFPEGRAVIVRDCQTGSFLYLETLFPSEILNRRHVCPYQIEFLYLMRPFRLADLVFLYAVRNRRKNISPKSQSQPHCPCPLIPIFQSVAIYHLNHMSNKSSALSALSRVHPDALGHILEWAGLNAIMALWKSGDSSIRMRITGAARSLKLLRASKDPINFPAHFVSQLRALRELVISSNSAMFSARILNIDRESMPKTLRVLKLKTNTSFEALTRRTDPASPFDLATVLPLIENIELVAPLDSSFTATESLGKRLLTFQNCNHLTSLVLHRVEVEGPYINMLPRGLTRLQLAMFEDWLGHWHEVQFPPSLLSLSLFQLRRYEGFLEQIDSCCPDISAIHISWSWSEDKLADSEEENFWGRLPRKLTSCTLLGGPSILLKEGALLLPSKLEELSLTLAGLDSTALDVLPKSLTRLAIRNEDPNYNRTGLLEKGADRRQTKYPGTVTNRQVPWSALPPKLQLLSLDIGHHQSQLAAYPHNERSFLPNLLEIPSATRPLLPDDWETSYLPHITEAFGDHLHTLPHSLTKLTAFSMLPQYIHTLVPLSLTTLTLNWDPNIKMGPVSDIFYRNLGQIKTLRNFTTNQRPNLLKLHHIGRTLDYISIMPYSYGYLRSYPWMDAAELPEDAITSSGLLANDKDSNPHTRRLKIVKSFGIAESWTFARTMVISSPSSALGLCQFVQLLPSSMPSLESLTFNGDEGRNQDAFPMLAQKCSSLTELILGAETREIVFSDLAALPQSIKYLRLDSGAGYGTLTAKAIDVVSCTPRDLIVLTLGIKFVLLPANGKEDTPENAPKHVKAALAHIQAQKPLWRSFVQSGAGPYNLSWQRPMSSDQFDILAHELMYK